MLQLSALDRWISWNISLLRATLDWSEMRKRIKRWKGIVDLLLRPDPDDSFDSVGLGEDVCYVLAPERFPGVTQVEQCRGVLIAIRDAVKREFLVVGVSEDVGTVEEPGVADGSVVKCGHDELIFIFYSYVADVY